jgi:hypothetical protein
MTPSEILASRFGGSVLCAFSSITMAIILTSTAAMIGILMATSLMIAGFIICLIPKILASRRKSKGDGSDADVTLQQSTANSQDFTDLHEVHLFPASEEAERTAFVPSAVEKAESGDSSAASTEQLSSANLQNRTGDLERPRYTAINEGITEVVTVVRWGECEGEGQEIEKLQYSYTKWRADPQGVSMYLIYLVSTKGTEIVIDMKRLNYKDFTPGALLRIPVKCLVWCSNPHLAPLHGGSGEDSSLPEFLDLEDLRGIFTPEIIVRE